jgi:hypothetical protein
MRNIEVQQFYSQDLRKGIEAFNLQAQQLDSERGQLEADLLHLKTEALSGSVEALATLTKRRENLKTKLLTNIIDSVRLAEERGKFRQPINEAYASERVKREEALAKRADEIEAVFQEHGLSMHLLNGVKLDTCAILKSAVQDVRQPPRIETEQDQALIVALRQRISEMMG